MYRFSRVIYAERKSQESCSRVFPPASDVTAEPRWLAQVLRRPLNLITRTTARSKDSKLQRCN